MRWINLPALAELEDRRGIVRRIYGPSILGRYEFAERYAQISELMAIDGSVGWAEMYRRSPQWRAAIDGALACWGLEPDWFSEQQIEALLLIQTVEGEGGEPTHKPGILHGLLPQEPSKGEAADLPSVLAAIATHCQGVEEALRLAGEVPADLLIDLLNSKAAVESEERAEEPKPAPDLDYLRANYEELMSRAKDL